jgi:hypothetical protein
VSNSDELFERLRDVVNVTCDYPVEVRFLSSDGEVFTVESVEYETESGTIFIKGELVDD